jgi:hypothetical protein
MDYSLRTSGTANTGRDGTGVIQWFPRSKGETYVRIIGVAQGNTAAGMARLFRRSPSGVKTLVEERDTAAATPTGTVKAATVTFVSVPIKLPAGARLGVALHNAEVWVFDAESE